MMEYKDKATIVLHSSVLGLTKTKVRYVNVSEPGEYAQYDRVISVVFIEPRLRKKYSYRIFPDNIRYCTIADKDGYILYDSRNEVPCDMERWQETENKWSKRRQVEKGRNGPCVH